MKIKILDYEINEINGYITDKLSLMVLLINQLDIVIFWQILKYYT